MKELLIIILSAFCIIAGDKYPSKKYTALEADALFGIPVESIFFQLDTVITKPNPDYIEFTIKDDTCCVETSSLLELSEKSIVLQKREQVITIQSGNEVLEIWRKQWEGCRSR